ncbi:hypothetical protein D3C74_406690 [compost metagenome]
MQVFCLHWAAVRPAAYKTAIDVIFAVLHANFFNRYGLFLEIDAIPFQSGYFGTFEAHNAEASWFLKKMLGRSRTKFVKVCDATFGSEEQNSITVLSS